MSFKQEFVSLCDALIAKSYGCYVSDATGSILIIFLTSHSEQTCESQVRDEQLCVSAAAAHLHELSNEQQALRLHTGAVELHHVAISTHKPTVQVTVVLRNMIMRESSSTQISLCLRCSQSCMSEV